MLMGVIQKELFALQDTKYRDFQTRLIPTVDPDTVIGVRTPELRKYAKQLIKSEDIEESLPVTEAAGISASLNRRSACGKSYPQRGHAYP